MKTKTKILRLMSLLVIFLFVSCSQDNAIFSDKQTGTGAKSANRAAAPALLTSLIFYNDTDFTMDAQLVCYASSSGFGLDSNVKLWQYVKIPARTNIALNDFATAATLGIAEDEWRVADNNLPVQTIDGATANALYGRFVNGVDNTEGYFANWASYYKPDCRGGILDPEDQSADPKYVESYNHFVFSEYFDPSGFVGAYYPQIVINLSDWNFNQNQAGLYPFLNINSSVVIDPVTLKCRVYIDQTAIYYQLL